jgi:Flp pilus assembly pilin Flp
MMNLVEKFTPEAVEATDDAGLVAIEYVIMAGVLVVVLVGVFTGAFGALTTELTDIIEGIDA